MSALPDRILHLDRPRRVHIGLTALRRIEGLTGCSFLRGTEGRVSWDSIEFLVSATWAALLRDDPELTIDRVEELIDDPAKLPEVEEVITAALRDALGKARAAREARTTATTPSRSTGSTSGPSGGTTSGSPTQSSGA